MLSDNVTCDMPLTLMIKQIKLDHIGQDIGFSPYLWGHNGTGADLMRPNPGRDCNGHFGGHRFFSFYFVLFLFFVTHFDWSIFPQKSNMKVLSGGDVSHIASL